MEVLKKIFTVFLAAWIVISTGGFFIYAHSCHCCSEKEISVVDFENCCDHEQPVTCDVQSAGQYPPNLLDTTHDQTCHADRCCSITHKFYKLDVTFDKSKNVPVKSYDDLARLEQVINEDLLYEDIRTEIVTTDDDNPPELSGKAFLIFAHQLKIHHTA